MTINIGQPKDENCDNLVMISYDDEAKSSKSLLKLKIKNLKWKKNKNRKPYKKPITKQNLQDALDFVFNDLETVDYSNDTRPDDLDNLETVDFNNDTSITELIPIKKT